MHISGKYGLSIYHVVARVTPSFEFDRPFSICFRLVLREYSHRGVLRQETWKSAESHLLSILVFDVDVANILCPSGAPMWL